MENIVVGTINTTNHSNDTIIFRASGKGIAPEAGNDVLSNDMMISLSDQMLNIDLNKNFNKTHDNVIMFEHNVGTQSSHSFDLNTSPLSVIPQDSVESDTNDMKDTVLMIDVANSDTSSPLHTVSSLMNHQPYISNINGGTVVVNSNGVITYTPAADNHELQPFENTATYSFRYNVGDFIVINEQIIGLGVDGSRQEITHQHLIDMITEYHQTLPSLYHIKNEQYLAIE